MNKCYSNGNFKPFFDKDTYGFSHQTDFQCNHPERTEKKKLEKEKLLEFHLDKDLKSTRHNLAIVYC